MSVDLHDSHRWAERDYEGDKLSYCIDCRVEGFADEPAAFAPCARPPKKSTKVCWRTMESVYLPGHIHLCELVPHEGDHICAECGRFFGKR